LRGGRPFFASIFCKLTHFNALCVRIVNVATVTVLKMSILSISASIGVGVCQAMQAHFFIYPKFEAIVWELPSLRFFMIA